MLTPEFTIGSTRQVVLSPHITALEAHESVDMIRQAVTNEIMEMMRRERLIAVEGVKYITTYDHDSRSVLVEGTCLVVGYGPTHINFK